MSKLWEAEALSENHTKLRLELINGKIVEGFSMGIEPGFDKETGEELEYDVLFFDIGEKYLYLRLKDSDIVEVKKAF